MCNSADIWEHILGVSYQLINATSTFSTLYTRYYTGQATLFSCFQKTALQRVHKGTNIVIKLTLPQGLRCVDGGVDNLYFWHTAPSHRHI